MGQSWTAVGKHILGEKDGRREEEKGKGRIRINIILLDTL